ncbi:MAG: recombinase family protein [Deltaproteobacteria bacterium]|nr:MAG: recombinase family protein [Deltaproteobacteria bacterium]
MKTPTPSHHKVRTVHLQRDAYLYVRQSSMRQVLENTESTKRQYQLRERALALGWISEQIRVIDCDQGCSGASDAGRDGFQQLVAEVSLGNAGIVMGLEVSRLARNNADWQRLLQLCAFTDTLILDQDGLYDPSAFNDRLLLGLKGTMSEAELHVLKSRLQQGILNKALRGELKIPLPVGLVYDELDRVVLSADTQVRETMKKFFVTFRRLRAASAVVKEFRRENIQVPHYSRTGPKSSRIIWGDLTHSQALRILHNPRYAGAFAYGRTRTRRGPDGIVRYHKQSQENWTCLIQDVHEGYISWDEYQSNQRILTANAQAYSSDRHTPPREGPALLQGIIMCGRCGKRMTVRYHQRRGQLTPEYICQRDKIEHGQSKNCQLVPGAAIDQSIGQMLVGMVNSKNIDVAVAVQRELQNRLDEADRLRYRHVERCRYEADLARRRYLKVDPEKRYVAEVLEAEWNEKLRTLDEAQSAYEAAKERDIATLSQNHTAALKALASDFSTIWQKDSLPNRDRKRIVRLLIEDVTIIRDTKLICHIRFKGGSCRTLNMPLPQPAWEQRRTPPEVVRAIDELLDDHPEFKVADMLTERGMKSGADQSFTLDHVMRIRIAYGLPNRWTRLRKQGKLLARELADKLGITCGKIRRCRDLGLLTAYEYKRGKYLYDDPGPGLVNRVPKLKMNAHFTGSHTIKEVQYAT